MPRSLHPFRIGGSSSLQALALSAFVAVSSCAKPQPRPGPPPSSGAAGRPAGSADSRDPAVVPPGGLKPTEVPLFVVFGFDDNAIAGADDNGGLRFVNDLFRGRKNPPGRGHVATFDGASAHFTF